MIQYLRTHRNTEERGLHVMDYVKLKSRSTIQGFIVTLAALLALSIGMVGLAGCSSGTSDEDAIRASLSSELDSIKNIDDAFVNEFSESIDMSQPRQGIVRH